MTSAKKKKKKKKKNFFFFFYQDDRYNTILSALETITKTAMRSVAIVMATTNKHIHTALIDEMVVYIYKIHVHYNKNATQALCGILLHQ